MSQRSALETAVRFLLSVEEIFPELALKLDVVDELDEHPSKNYRKKQIALNRHWKVISSIRDLWIESISSIEWFLQDYTDADLQVLPALTITVPDATNLSWTEKVHRGLLLFLEIYTWAHVAAASLPPGPPGQSQYSSLKRDLRSMAFDISRLFSSSHVLVLARKVAFIENGIKLFVL